MNYVMFILFVLSFNASAEPVNACSSDSAKQAKKLLSFHINSLLDNDLAIENEMEFEDPTIQKPIKNQSKTQQIQNRNLKYMKLLATLILTVST
jgi:hypothetical protein